MKNLLIALAIFLLLPACLHRAPKPPEPRRIEVIPNTKEAKECVRECKKMKIMEKQLANQEYLAKKAEHDADCDKYSTAKLRRNCRANFTYLSSRDLDELGADINYTKCFEDCGGSWRTEGLEDTMKDTAEQNMMDENAVYDPLENGIVKDTETGLEWKVGPERNIMWDVAKSLIQNMKLDGGGWRMPTEVELKRLYLIGVKPRNIGFLLKVDGWAVWSIEAKDSEAKYVYFIESGEGYWYNRYESNGMRTIAVRSPKK